jgi:putative MATE family efflux protein
MADHHTRLGTAPIGRILWRLSLPATVGMTVLALYTLVDTIFIGRAVGTLGIAGVAIAFPIMMIIMALSQLIGIGGASIVSRALGAKKIRLAEQTLGTAISLVIIIGITVTVLGMLFLKPLLILFGATPTLLPFSASYLQVSLIGTVFMMFLISSNAIIRAEGDAKTSMWLMIISALVNLILDPIFIFIMGWGMAGAALASVISWAAVSFYIVYYFFSKGAIHCSFSTICINKNIMKEIFAVGSSTFGRQSAASLVMIVVFNSLAHYGSEVDIAAIGVVNRLLSFFFMPLFGIVQGMQPIVGFNYGAKKFGRVKHALWLSLFVVVSFSIIGSLALMLFPSQLTSIFTKDASLIATSAYAMRILVIAIPLVGISIVGAAFFQSIGKARPAFILSLSRQVIFLIPLLLILPRFFAVNGVWYAFPIADGFAILLSSVLLIREIRSL